MPMPGASDSGMYPPSRLYWLTKTALAGCSSLREHSWVTKLGMDASTWIAAPVVMGPRKLCVARAEWYDSARAAIFLTWVRPLLVAWMQRHDEVQSVTFAAAGFRSNRKSHAEFERMVLTIAGVAK